MSKYEYKPRRHRRRLGRSGDFLHRRRGQSQGRAGRKTPHGRRLPEHGLCAFEGADSLGFFYARHPPRACVGLCQGRSRDGLRPDYGASAAGDSQNRAARFDRALHFAGASIASPTKPKIVSPNEVQVGERVLKTRSIVVCAGAAPFVPPIPGIEKANYKTSDTIWEIREKPRRMVVIGGGPIGSELTQAFAYLGVEVTQIEGAPRIMSREGRGLLAHRGAPLRGNRSQNYGRHLRGRNPKRRRRNGGFVPPQRKRRRDAGSVRFAFGRHRQKAQRRQGRGLGRSGRAHRQARARFRSTNICAHPSPTSSLAATSSARINSRTRRDMRRITRR